MIIVLKCIYHNFMVIKKWITRHKRLSGALSEVWYRAQKEKSSLSMYDSIYGHGNAFVWGSKHVTTHKPSPEDNLYSTTWTQEVYGQNHMNWETASCIPNYTLITVQTLFFSVWWGPKCGTWYNFEAHTVKDSYQSIYSFFKWLNSYFTCIVLLW